MSYNRTLFRRGIVRAHPMICQIGTYIALLFNLSAPWGLCSTPHPDRLPWGKKPRYQFCRRMAWPQIGSGRVCTRITGFYCCAVHFNNIKILFTNECTFYWTYKMSHCVRHSIHTTAWNTCCHNTAKLLTMHFTDNPTKV
jgi:hypothetical protein